MMHIKVYGKNHMQALISTLNINQTCKVGLKYQGYVSNIFPEGGHDADQIKIIYKHKF